MKDQIILAVPTNGAGGLEAERSAHFGRCDTFTLVDINEGSLENVRTVQNPPHVEGGCLASVNLLASHDVTAILVAGMGARPLAGFNAAGISVYFESGTADVADAITLLLAGKVEVMDDRFACGGH